ncbi:hypothetical protein Tco_0670515 [Tanacetum coccineum]
MVNIVPNAEIAGAFRQAGDAMLPQIREQVREELPHGAGASGLSRQRRRCVGPYFDLGSFQRVVLSSVFPRAKTRALETRVPIPYAKGRVENSRVHAAFLRLDGFLGQDAGTAEELAKELSENYGAGLRPKDYRGQQFPPILPTRQSRVPSGAFILTLVFAQHGDVDIQESVVVCLVLGFKCGRLASSAGLQEDLGASSLGYSGKKPEHQAVVSLTLLRIQGPTFLTIAMAVKDVFPGSKNFTGIPPIAMWFSGFTSDASKKGLGDQKDDGRKQLGIIQNIDQQTEFRVDDNGILWQLSERTIQTIRGSVTLCALDMGGNWVDSFMSCGSLPTISSSAMRALNALLSEMLFGKGNVMLLLLGFREGEKLKESSDSSEELRRKDIAQKTLEFPAGVNNVFLKVSPQWSQAFWLSRHLSQVHYRVSCIITQRFYMYHPLHVVSYHSITIREEDLSYTKELSYSSHTSGQSSIEEQDDPFVKILWRNHPEREATWETEESIGLLILIFFHDLDYKWYEALEESELKDKALRNQAIMEGFIKEDDDESLHELPVCNIRRYMMIKYSFNNDEEYVAVKEDEYDDPTITREEACRAYQEIFRKIDEGWMVTRAE